MKAELCRERPLCWILTFFVVWMIQKIFHTFNVYILMCSHICIHPWYHQKTKVLYISITSKDFLFFGKNTYMRSLLLLYFTIHNTILLTTGTMLYSRCLELTHFAYQKLYIHWKTISYFLFPQVPGKPPFYFLWLFWMDVSEPCSICHSVTGLFHIIEYLVDSSMLS